MNVYDSWLCMIHGLVVPGPPDVQGLRGIPR